MATNINCPSAEDHHPNRRDTSRLSRCSWSSSSSSSLSSNSWSWNQTAHRLSDCRRSSRRRRSVCRTHVAAFAPRRQRMTRRTSGSRSSKLAKRVHRTRTSEGGCHCSSSTACARRDSEPCIEGKRSRNREDLWRWVACRTYRQRPIRCPEHRSCCTRPCAQYSRGDL
jgi:hypothetical protein